MLTTRCPDCQTTFRITSVVLHQAEGQVRCGQCGAEFSAFDSLIDTITGAPAEVLPVTASEPMVLAGGQVAHSADGGAAVGEAMGESISEASNAHLVDAAQQTAEPDDNHTTEVEPDVATISEAQVEEVLEEPLPQTWRPAETPVEPEPRYWRIAAALALFALALQSVHHFRSQLVEVPFVGVTLSSVYNALGMAIPDDTDPAVYSIVEWVATASEDGNDGTLDISTSVRNDANVAVAYPLLSLELTDRWEKIIAARVFTPQEYLGRNLADTARMQPQATLQAQLQLVDPGPDAYGFEVDICVRVDARSMRCKSDSVFE